MQYETAERWRSRYTRNMQTEYMQAMLTGMCMLLIGGLGYVAGITSLVGWIALLALALTPTVVMMSVRRAPARTMSETIRHALR
jgi:hypothetical protein